MDKKIVLSLGAVLLLVVLVISSLFITRSNRVKKSEKTLTAPTSTSTTSSPDKDSTTTTLETTQAQKDTIDVSLTSPVEGQTFSDSVPVRVIIAGITTGKCTVIFTQESAKEVSAKADVVVAPTYSTCSGFDIKRSEFSKPGKWNVKVIVESGSQKGTSQTREIVIS